MGRGYHELLDLLELVHAEDAPRVAAVVGGVYVNVLISKSIDERHIAAAPRPGLGRTPPICLYLGASHLQADNFRRIEILIYL